jgi:hypothetical protein
MHHHQRHYHFLEWGGGPATSKRRLGNTMRVGRRWKGVHGAGWGGHAAAGWRGRRRNAPRAPPRVRGGGGGARAGAPGRRRLRAAVQPRAPRRGQMSGRAGGGVGWPHPPKVPRAAAGEPRGRGPAAVGYGPAGYGAVFGLSGESRAVGSSWVVCGEGGGWQGPAGAPGRGRIIIKGRGQPVPRRGRGSRRRVIAQQKGGRAGVRAPASLLPRRRAAALPDRPAHGEGAAAGQAPGGGGLCCAVVTSRSTRGRGKRAHNRQADVPGGSGEGSLAGAARARPTEGPARAGARRSRAPAASGRPKTSTRR